MQFPNDLPDDLRRALTEVMGRRSCGPADIWGAVKEWLAKHEVEPTESVRGAARNDEITVGRYD